MPSLFIKIFLPPLHRWARISDLNPGPFFKPTRFGRKPKIDALRSVDEPHTQLAFTGRVIRQLRETLNEELPLIGFAGAPLTLAFFLIAGESPIKRGTGVSEKAAPVFQMMEEAPELLHRLLNKLTEMTINYLNYQISEGVSNSATFRVHRRCLTEARI